MNNLIVTLLALSLMWTLTNCTNMSNKTVLNENYKGLVVGFTIPAEVHERDGKKYASYGSVVPIHSCSKEQIAELAVKTHHYADIFTEQVLSPLGELAYVRIDENTAEKVFINRAKRILVVSSDGVLAMWRCAPTFESNNTYIAGTPIVNASGELLSIVTVKRGNHYAVSNIEGEGGYFTTPTPWKTHITPEGYLSYGLGSFPTREDLRTYITSLPLPVVTPTEPPTPVLHIRSTPRVALVASKGYQIAHIFLNNVIVSDVEYL